MEKYGTVCQTIHENIVWRMRHMLIKLRPQTCTDDAQYLLLFHGNSGYANAAHFYIHTYVVCLANLVIPVL